MSSDDDCAHDEHRAPTRLHGMPFWLLGRASRRAGIVTQEHLAAAGLHRYWYGVLATIDEFGPAAQAEIGRRLGVDPSDMVAAVTGMVEAGLVTRDRDPSDRRRNLVALTTAGRRRLTRFDRAIADAESDYLDALSASERRTLVRLLRRIAFPG